MNTDIALFLMPLFYGVGLFLVVGLALDAILTLLIRFIRWLGGE